MNKVTGPASLVAAIGGNTASDTAHSRYGHEGIETLQWLDCVDVLMTDQKISELTTVTSLQNTYKHDNFIPRLQRSNRI